MFYIHQRPPIKVILKACVALWTTTQVMTSQDQMERCIKTLFSLQNHVRLLENYFSYTIFAQSVSRESNFKLNLFSHLLLYRVYMFFWFAVFD